MLELQRTACVVKLQTSGGRATQRAGPPPNSWLEICGLPGRDPSVFKVAACGADRDVGERARKVGAGMLALPDAVDGAVPVENGQGEAVEGVVVGVVVVGEDVAQGADQA
jgi:hypothetical protein